MNFNNPNERNELSEHPFETTSVFGETYNVDKLFDYADRVPVQEVSLSTLGEAVAEGHYYWTDKHNKKLGPFDLLQDWEVSLQNPNWVDHVDNIKNADLQWPIWITADGHVFNGMHRLTRCFVEGISPVKIRVFDSLPPEAIVD